MPGATTPLNIPYPVAGDTMAACVTTIPQLQAERVNDLLAAVSGVAPTAWADCTMRTNFDHIIGVRTQIIRRAGMVTLALGVNFTAAGNWAAGVWAFTLPAGFRPSRNLYVDGTALSDGVNRSLILQTDGAVTIRFAGTGAIVGTVTYAV